MAKYMPQAGKLTSDAAGGSSSPREALSCRSRELWTALDGSGVVSRLLLIHVRMHGGAGGIAEARSMYQQEWRTLAQASTLGDLGRDLDQHAPEQVPGIGDEAFISYATFSIGGDGGAHESMTVRTQNTDITVAVQGVQYPRDPNGEIRRDKAVPLGEAGLREAVMAFTRDVTSSLAKCEPCRRS
ncbi:hypothetical protein [Actinomadura fibrosa]|uniref:Uncharacterized protein n=1 Tax=Actinomadura fibrosa TaxID=111802 RepID=A0ABW2XSJ4_9ACTN|nr:hypothetical protein [Actinomadura fibrosa]